MWVSLTLLLLSALPASDPTSDWLALDTATGELVESAEAPGRRIEPLSSVPRGANIELTPEGIQVHSRLVEGAVALPAPPVAATLRGNVVYFTLSGWHDAHTVVAWNGLTRRVEWEVPTWRGSRPSGPAALEAYALYAGVPGRGRASRSGPSGDVVLVGNTGVVGLNPLTGHQRWRVDEPRLSAGRPHLWILQGLLLVYSEGTLLAIGDDGREAWRASLPVDGEAALWEGPGDVSLELSEAPTRTESQPTDSPRPTHPTALVVRTVPHPFGPTRHILEPGRREDVPLHWRGCRLPIDGANIEPQPVLDPIYWTLHPPPRDESPGPVVLLELDTAPGETRRFRVPEGQPRSAVWFKVHDATSGARLYVDGVLVARTDANWGVESLQPAHAYGFLPAAACLLLLLPLLVQGLVYLLWCDAVRFTERSSPSGWTPDERLRVSWRDTRLLLALHGLALVALGVARLRLSVPWWGDVPVAALVVANLLVLRSCSCRATRRAGTLRQLLPATP